MNNTAPLAMKSDLIWRERALVALALDEDVPATGAGCLTDEQIRAACAYLAQYQNGAAQLFGRIYDRLLVAVRSGGSAH